MKKALEITSPAFSNKQNIPSRYTCDGANINPPLEFINVPPETESLTLIVEDPDAPGKTWIHWVVFNIDPKTTKVREGSIPGHGKEAVTDFGRIGYGGPCPPNGPHRYSFKLFALDTKLMATEDISREEIESLIKNHIIEKAELTGIYSRD